MDNEALTGFMTVFAVSGSVVILAHQFHKRLLSDFMNKMEFELGTSFKNTHIMFLFLNKRGMHEHTHTNTCFWTCMHGS